MPILTPGDAQGAHHEDGRGGPGDHRFNHGAVILQRSRQHFPGNAQVIVFGLEGIADDETGGKLIGGQCIGDRGGAQR